MPLSLDELRRVVPFGRPVVFAVGHPLARGVFEHLSAEIPNSLVIDPTVSAMLAALLKGIGPGTESIAKPRFAQRMSRLGTENAFEVLAVVNRLRAEGRDIVSFAIGEPDFPSPANVKRAGSRAIEENKTHYGESAGLRELREAVAGYVRRTRHIEVEPDNVVVTPGAKPILFNTIMSVVNPGDEVIYPNPGFPIYESLIDFVGAKGVPLPLWESLDFNFDPDEFRRRVTPKTRLIILNTPQNPTGGILTSDALKVVADVAQEHDIWVLSDEVYSQMVYDGEFTSIATIPGMSERTVVLDGFSKTYSMTGWRLGFGVMPVALARQQARIETNLNSCTATFTQWAGVEALNGSQEESLAMIAEFRRRRSIIVDGLNGIPGFSCRMPAGAFYAFPNVTEACKMLGLADSKALQEHLLFQGNVAALPRTSFGRRNTGETDEYLRFSYATSAALIDQGLERIRKVMRA
jgi:aspartate/methionine/tyrosine aminotransferase